MSAQETVANIKDQGGLAIAAHPFSRIAGSSLENSFIENYKLFHAIEVANSNNILRIDDAKAKAFAISHNIPMISGSDAHLPCGIGSNIVEMKDFNCPESFLNNLKSASINNRLHPLKYFIDMGIWTVYENFCEVFDLGQPIRGLKELSHA